jgi:hypothetical protein
MNLVVWVLAALVPVLLVVLVLVTMARSRRQWGLLQERFAPVLDLTHFEGEHAGGRQVGQVEELTLFDLLEGEQDAAGERPGR